MYTKVPSTLLLALFAFLLVSVNALPRVLHANVTPTPTTPLPSESASFSVQPSSQMMSSMAAPTLETHPTLRAIPNAPMAEFEEESSTIEETSTEETATKSSTTPIPSAIVTSLASSLSLLTSVTRFLSSFSGLFGMA